MRRTRGLTILEVVVAVGLLTSVLAALIVLQAQSLQTQSRLRAMRQLVAVAEDELDRRLSLERLGSDDCADMPPGIIRCTSTVEACQEPRCLGAGGRRALRVLVSGEGERAQLFELETLTLRWGAG